MAYIHFRKVNEPSIKKNWIPPNRKYKWMFYVSVLLNIMFTVAMVLTRK